MNMEVSEESMKQAQLAPSAVSSAPPFSFFFPPNNSTSSQMAYGVEELYSQLSVMPLRSDGSLCIRDTLSRSQLEDLFNGINGYPHQNTEQQTLREGMFSGLVGQEMFQQPLGEELVAEAGISSLKNLVTQGLGFEDLHYLSLSMNPGPQSSYGIAPQYLSPPASAPQFMALNSTKKRGTGKGSKKQPVHRKTIDSFGQRTSRYRGVTRHRWTGRYEAHLWDNSCKKEGQTRKGRQVYLGGYDMEEKAARAYDLAALKYWGPSTHINFPLENYHEELEEMKNMNRQEYVSHLRRKSSGFSRGASIYRGVTRHHQHGRWQARIGRVAGNKDLYLGTFSTQEEAAEAYDIAAIKFRGGNAVTNFKITRYDVEKIMASSTLLTADLARRSTDTPVEKVLHLTGQEHTNGDGGSDNWKMILELHNKPHPMYINATSWIPMADQLPWFIA